MQQNPHKLLDCQPESQSDHISAHKLTQLLHAFNNMFEQNGGAHCVSRVKQIADHSLATMSDPVHLAEPLQKELNHAKLTLDKTLQRLDSAIRTNATEVYSQNFHASAAAEAVIEETKQNNFCKDIPRRNSTLLTDCCRLLAVFATNICASVLESVERDSHMCAWSERVQHIESISSRGIPQLRIIAKRFAEAIGQGRTDILAGWTTSVADAAIQHVVQCVALAIAALQIEVADRAYQCFA